MKTKLLSLMLVAMLSLGVIAFTPIAKADDPIMYMDPSTVNLEYLVWPIPNPRWNISIMVDNLPLVTTIACSVKSTDFSKVIVRAWYKGAIFQDVGMDFSLYLYESFNATDGDLVGLTAGTTSGGKNIVDPIEVFKIEVEGLNYTGGTGADIYMQGAVDEGSVDLLGGGDCLNDQTVTITQPPPPPPFAPTAAFSFAPPMPYDGDPIAFDASASLAGWDGANMCPITEYRWDWENDGVIDETNAIATASHSFTPAGTYYVNLTVYAPPGIGANVTYVPTDDIVKPVTVYPKATGRAIDLYTQDWRYPGYITDIIGLAPAPYGSQVDSYAPQDLVCLYAKLTYNGEPICYKEVAFEIHGPYNSFQNITIWRQAFTNGSGIAEICFRIPWPDVHAEDIVFGPWWALAKASVANEWVADAHWWLVHWIVEIVDETVEPNPVEELGTLTVTIWVHNYALTPRNFTFTAVLYDELLVPVGAAYVDVPNAPPGDSGPYSVDIFVPEWAYVGIGTVYKNLFTMLPWNCGVCWSPEQSEVVVISATDPHIPPF